MTKKIAELCHKLRELNPAANMVVEQLVKWIQQTFSERVCLTQKQSK